MKHWVGDKLFHGGNDNSDLYTYAGPYKTVKNSFADVMQKPPVSISEDTEIILPDNTKITGKELSLIVKYLLPKIREEYTEEFL